METKLFLTIFTSIFIAELADKTQMVTILFAADRDTSKWMVFAAAASALVLASAIGVLAGSALSAYINEKVLECIAGVGFIGIGSFTLYRAIA
jgi:putative Ca2+/H+ antiporter (TMEM165/GDT1 family)